MIFGNYDDIFDPAPIYTFLDTGRVAFTLVAHHEIGCTYTLQRWVDVIPVTSYFLSNAFTPNSDSKNDIFKGNRSVNIRSY